MYQDSNRIRGRRVSINLDEYEARLIDALVDYTGCQHSTLLRQLALAEARQLLTDELSLGQGELLKQEHSCA